MKDYLIFNIDGSKIKTPAIVVPITAPYAERVFWMTKAHEAKHGIDDMPPTFEEFCKQMYKNMEYGRKI